MQIRFTRQIKYFCLFFVFVVLLQVPEKSFSKYQTVTNSDNSNASVASFIFLSNVDISLPLYLDEKLYPGIMKEYYFTIQNYNEDKVSDITLNYSIAINKTSNLPIDINIYRNDILLDIDEQSLFNYTLNKGEYTLDNYKVVIEWDLEYNDYIYAALTDSIFLNIIAEQVD